jgi:hypothetical protein
VQYLTISFAYALFRADSEYFCNYVTIEELAIYPTTEQAIKCLILCQMLSNCYQDIHLFRFDEPTAEVYILAGNNLQIIVPPSGNWRFVA